MADEKRSRADVFAERNAFAIRFIITQLSNINKSKPESSHALENELTAVDYLYGLMDKLIDTIKNIDDMENQIDKLKKQLHDETVAHTKLRDECHPQGDPNFEVAGDKE